MAPPVVRQAELYWVDDEEPYGSEPGFRRPWLVVQNNVINASAISTVLACPLTSNLRRAQAIGSVVLERGESGLPSASAVQALGLSALNRNELDEYIGTVSRTRMAEVLRGIFSTLEPREP